MICRFLQAAFVIFIFVANLAAQAPTPRLPAQVPSGTAAQVASKSPALPSVSPSVTATTEDLVNSLGPADLQAVITLLKSNSKHVLQRDYRRAHRIPAARVVEQRQSSGPGQESQRFPSEKGERGNCRSSRQWDGK